MQVNASPAMQTILQIFSCGLPKPALMQFVGSPCPHNLPAISGVGQAFCLLWLCMREHFDVLKQHL